MSDTAEDIVRALAKRMPTAEIDFATREGCALCGSESGNPDDHDVACEWRRAIEWMEKQP
jgi:hypothetical protein